MESIPFPIQCVHEKLFKMIKLPDCVAESEDGWIFTLNLHIQKEKITVMNCKLIKNNAEYQTVFHSHVGFSFPFV
jgi:hypothetical protein